VAVVVADVVVLAIDDGVVGEAVVGPPPRVVGGTTLPAPVVGVVVPDPEVVAVAGSAGTVTSTELLASDFSSPRTARTARVAVYGAVSWISRIEVGDCTSTSGCSVLLSR
jgi:hypothetical protein